MKIILLFALLLSTSPLFATTDTTIVCADLFEPNNDWEHAKGISGSIRAMITSCDDEDWYSFHVGPNQKLTVTLDSLDGDFSLQVQQFTWTYNFYHLITVGTADHPGTQPEVVVVDDGPDADYYVRVFTANGDTGCYSLHYEITATDACPDPYESNDIYPGTYLYNNVPVSARISSGNDIDLFDVSGSTFGLYTKVTLTFTDGGGYYLALVDSRRNDDGSLYELYTNVDYTGNQVILYYDNPDERSYYVYVQGWGRHTDCYTLNISSDTIPFFAAKAKLAASRAGIYPVPAHQVLYDVFESTVNKQQLVTVTDMSGKVVYRQVYGVIAGTNRLEIKLPSGLVDGVYILSDGVSAKKFVLKR